MKSTGLPAAACATTSTEPFTESVVVGITRWAGSNPGEAASTTMSPVSSVRDVDGPLI